MPKMKHYQNIAADLRESIHRGEYGPGHQLPSGNTLSRQYGVARQTVQNAIDVLRREDLVIGRQGAGWFVAEPRLRYHASDIGSRRKRLAGNRQQDTFEQQIEPQGRKTRQVCAIETPPASTDIAQRLQVAPGTPVGLRRRIMYANDEPVQLGDSYYPLDIVDGSKLMHPEGVVEGDDQVLEDLGHIPTRYSDELTWRMPIGEEIRELDIAPGIPILRMVRTSYDQNDRPIEVYVVILPGDRYVMFYDVSAE